MRDSFGPHLMLDLNDCNVEISSSLQKCWDFLNELPEFIGMTKITQPHVFPYSGLVPEDKGITGVVIIAESHISIHTFPLKNFIFIDVFSCKDFDVEKTINFCKDFFGTRDCVPHTVTRGVKFPVLSTC